MIVTVSESSLADWLDRRISASGKTQNAVATYCGVSHSAVSAWRKGERIPDPPYCWKLAEFFGEDIEDLMRLAGHLPPKQSEVREGPQLDPGVVRALQRLTLDEQREAALPAIETAELILRAARKRAEE